MRLVVITSMGMTLLKNKREKKKKVCNDVLAYKTPEKKDPYMKFKDIPISEDETKKNFMRVLFNNFHNK